MTGMARFQISKVQEYISLHSNWQMYHCQLDGYPKKLDVQGAQGLAELDVGRGLIMRQVHRAKQLEALFIRYANSAR